MSPAIRAIRWFNACDKPLRDGLADRLPLLKALCYSPAGDRPVQSCTGFGPLVCFQGENVPKTGNRNTLRRGSPLAETCASIR
jgi:hypothetical protein